MIKSMTGYGRSCVNTDGMNITVEIKSVNHRYLEFSSRCPRTYGFLDEKLKSYVSSRVSRGKVECFVQIENLEDESVVVEVNHSLAKGYFDAIRQIGERYGIDNKLTAETLSRYPDVLAVRKEEADEEKIWNAVRLAAEEAVDRFIEMRTVEGEKLREDILSRAEHILSNVAFIEKRSPETVRIYNEKLVARMRELLGDSSIDEARILTEAAIFADKIAVAEETVRLRSHISQLEVFLDSQEAIGRKTDFLVQEMNREANTIGSKAQDIEIASKVIEIKAEIEKIREQIQNIE